MKKLQESHRKLTENGITRHGIAQTVTVSPDSSPGPGLAAAAGQDFSALWLEATTKTNRRRRIMIN